jgi:hypothetical protein
MGSRPVPAKNCPPWMYTTTGSSGISRTLFAGECGCGCGCGERACAYTDVEKAEVEEAETEDGEAEDGEEEAEEEEEEEEDGERGEGEGGERGGEGRGETGRARSGVYTLRVRHSSACGVSAGVGGKTVNCGHMGPYCAAERTSGAHDEGTLALVQRWAPETPSPYGMPRNCAQSSTTTPCSAPEGGKRTRNNAEE